MSAAARHNRGLGRPNKNGNAEPLLELQRRIPSRARLPGGHEIQQVAARLTDETVEGIFGQMGTEEVITVARVNWGDF